MGGTPGAGHKLTLGESSTYTQKTLMCHPVLIHETMEAFDAYMKDLNFYNAAGQEKLDVYPIERFQMDGLPVLWFVKDTLGNDVASAYWQPWNIKVKNVCFMGILPEPKTFSEIRALMSEDLPLVNKKHRIYWGNTIINNYYFKKRQKFWYIEMTVLANDESIFK